MVVSDMLAGGGDGAGMTLGNYTLPTIDPDTIGTHSKGTIYHLDFIVGILTFLVAAIVLYGDPRHTANQTYNVGDVAATGVRT